MLLQKIIDVLSSATSVVQQIVVELHLPTIYRPKDIVGIAEGLSMLDLMNWQSLDAALKNAERLHDLSLQLTSGFSWPECWQDCIRCRFSPNIQSLVHFTAVEPDT